MSKILVKLEADTEEQLVILLKNLKKSEHVDKVKLLNIVK